MPVHDWTRVESGIFHDFHAAWITEIRKVLNDGLLPEGFYALGEQHVGRSVADVLTLHASPPSWELLPLLTGVSGSTVAEAPPKVQRRQTVELPQSSRRRTLAIRHISGHRLVALVEIVSRANKDRARSVDDFATKAVEALEFGVHLLIVDLIPPGAFDPQGIHAILLQRLERSDEPYDLPANEPLTLASYAAGPFVEVYLEHLAVGASLPEMPLFLTADRYIRLPLESTYMAAYGGTPAFWRRVLEENPIDPA